MPFTSISQRALELVAEVADCLSVVLRKTCCCFLYSSQVRNFSCSAWNSLTTSPWQRHKQNITLLHGISTLLAPTVCTTAVGRKPKTPYPLQNIFPVVAKLHEQGDLPAGVAVDGINLQHVADIRATFPCEKLNDLRDSRCNTIKTKLLRVPPLCSQGCPAARCYWHEEAALHLLASVPPCLQPPP